MRKKVMIALLLVLLCLLVSISVADEIDSFTFRDLKWYSNPNDASLKMNAIPGVSKPWYGAVRKNEKIEGWYKKWRYFYTDDAVSNGGAILKYTNVPIAGYSANVELSFMWTIRDNRVVYDYDSTEFYMGIYTIDGYRDLKGVYEEIKGKLKDLYGNYVSHSYYEGGMEGVKWTATDGSLIWLRICQNTVYKNYEDITVTYFAPNGAERLQELSNCILQEAIDKEDEKREKNKDNYDGL